MRVEKSESKMLAKTFLILLFGAAVGCEDRSLVAKKHALAGFQPTSISESKDPLQIKGKVAIVWQQRNGNIDLDRFTFDGTFANSPLNTRSVYPPEVYARTVDEIDTLVKVTCRTHSGDAIYKSSDSPMGAPGTRQTFNNTICDVTVNDYRTKTQLAKTTMGDEQTPSILNDATYADEVTRQVITYLRSIPLELVPGSGAKPQPTR